MTAASTILPNGSASARGRCGAWSLGSLGRPPAQAGRTRGATPVAVAQTRRVHFAKKLIDETSLPMTQVAMASGFGSVRRFNATFQKLYGRSPRALRNG